MPTVALKPRPRRAGGGDVNPVDALREIGFLLERSRADTTGSGPTAGRRRGRAR